MICFSSLIIESAAILHSEREMGLAQVVVVGRLGSFVKYADFDQAWYELGPSFGMRGAEPLIRLDFLKSIGHYNLHWLTPIQHISVSEDL